MGQYYNQNSPHLLTQMKNGSTLSLYQCRARRNMVASRANLMGYIDRTVATELRVAKNCDVGLFGAPDQDRKFREQMASIQIELSSFKFGQIRSLPG